MNWWNRFERLREPFAPELLRRSGRAQWRDALLIVEDEPGCRVNLHVEASGRRRAVATARSLARSTAAFLYAISASPCPYSRP